MKPTAILARCHRCDWPWLFQWRKTGVCRCPLCETECEQVGEVEMPEAFRKDGE